MHSFATAVLDAGAAKAHRLAIIPPSSPGERAQSRSYLSGSSFVPIRSGVLLASQFPATLTDAHGTFTKPPSW